MSEVAVNPCSEQRKRFQQNIILGRFENIFIHRALQQVIYNEESVREYLTYLETILSRALTDDEIVNPQLEFMEKVPQILYKILLIVEIYNRNFENERIIEFEQIVIRDFKDKFDWKNFFGILNKYSSRINLLLSLLVFNKYHELIERLVLGLNRSQMIQDLELIELNETLRNIKLIHLSN